MGERKEFYCNEQVTNEVSICNGSCDHNITMMVCGL